MEFTQIGVLTYLWLLIPLLALLWFAVKKQWRRLMLFNSSQMSKTMTRRAHLPRLHIKAAMIWLAFGLLIVTLSGPRWGFEWREVKRSGLDIMVALDVSKSMLAADFKPNRLERAKREIIDLLDMAKGDRIGLLAFAGTAFVQCPLTSDYGATKMFIRYLNPDLIPVQGTALGEAILLATKSLDESSSEQSRGKAIVIISDGEDQGQRVDEAIEAAKKSGVRVFTIGMGDPSGAPIPDTNGGFKKDNAGNLILTKLNEDVLKKVASATNGDYVRSTPGDFDLEKIYTTGIRQLEAGEYDDQTFREKIWFERYQVFLALVLGLLLLEGMILRTRPLVSRKTRKEQSVVKQKLPVSDSIMAVLILAFASFPIELRANEKEAHKLFEQQKYEESAQQFQNAEVDSPGDERILYNKGVALYKSGKFEEAKRIFEQLSKSSHEELAPLAEFNKANSEFMSGKIEGAIETYEKLLQKSPEDKRISENLAHAKKVLEQQQQQQQDQQEKNQEQSEKKNEQQNNEQQNNEQNQADNQNKSSQENQKEQSAQNQEEEKKEQQQETAENNPEQKQEKQDKKEEKATEQKQQQTAEQSGKDQPRKLDEKEANRLLRSVDDKMAKYLMKPSPDELQEYIQKDIDKDW